ncbi:MAG: HsdM family class I SAM-dependent methyltransferase, partial [Terriglobia bacterium]
HTSSNWGVSRQKVHVEELLRVPFRFPDDAGDSQRSWEIVTEVSAIVADAAARAQETFFDRRELVREAEHAIAARLDEYFDILPAEKTLIEDTTEILIPSARPSRESTHIPTVAPSKDSQGEEYAQRLSKTLNDWAKGSPFVVESRWLASSKLGVGMTVLQKTKRGSPPLPKTEDLYDVLAALQGLRTAAGQRFNTFELIRGAKVFDRDRLYLVKPIAQRFWTETAALNDADEIAGTILMHTPREAAAWR